MLDELDGQEVSELARLIPTPTEMAAREVPANEMAVHEVPVSEMPLTSELLATHQGSPVDIERVDVTQFTSKGKSTNEVRTEAK